jgi:hypothetical protein
MVVVEVVIGRWAKLVELLAEIPDRLGGRDHVLAQVGYHVGKVQHQVVDAKDIPNRQFLAQGRSALMLVA